jgi:ribosomal protein S18 acetylase RimI-like enzyme
MNTLNVRGLEAGQGPLYRELRIAALRDAPYAFGSRLEDVLATDPAAFDESARRFAGSESTTSFVLYSNDEPVGLIGAFFEDSAERRAFVCALWVRPAVRHLRGGELLVSTAVSWLEQRGARSVYAWVADANARARIFYEHLGFIVTGLQQPLTADPGAWETLLVKKL